MRLLFVFVLTSLALATRYCAANETGNRVKRGFGGHHSGGGGGGGGGLLCSMFNMCGSGSSSTSGSSSSLVNSLTNILGVGGGSSSSWNLYAKIEKEGHINTIEELVEAVSIELQSMLQRDVKLSTNEKDFAANKEHLTSWLSTVGGYLSPIYDQLEGYALDHDDSRLLARLYLNEYRRDVASNLNCSNVDVDLALVVDGSGSIDEEDFEKMKEFMVKLVDHVTDSSTVSLVHYSGNPFSEFIRETSKAEMKKQISAMKKHTINTGTETGSALKYVYGKVFPTKTADANRQKVMIVLTDGQSQDPDIVDMYAPKIRQQGVVTYAIGIGHNIMNEELHIIAGRLYRVFRANDFKQLDKALSNEIVREMCVQAEAEQRAKTCKKTDIDALFVLDGSGSIGDDNFIKLKQFVVDMIDKLTANSRVAVMKFSTDQTIEFDFNRYPNSNQRSQLKRHVERIKYKRGGTLIGEALDRAQDDILRPTKGDRVDVPNVVLTFTDGQSQDSVVNVSNSLRMQGETMIVIGVGDELDQYQLLSVAGSTRRVYSINNFDELDVQLERDLDRLFCEEIREVIESGNIVKKISITITLEPALRADEENLLEHLRGDFAQKVSPDRDIVDYINDADFISSTEVEIWLIDNIEFDSSLVIEHARKLVQGGFFMVNTGESNHRVSKLCSNATACTEAKNVAMVNLEVKCSGAYFRKDGEKEVDDNWKFASKLLEKLQTELGTKTHQLLNVGYVNRQELIITIMAIDQADLDALVELAQDRVREKQLKIIIPDFPRDHEVVVTELCNGPANCASKRNDVVKTIDLFLSGGQIQNNGAAKRELVDRFIEKCGGKTSELRKYIKSTEVSIESGTHARLQVIDSVDYEYSALIKKARTLASTGSLVVTVQGVKLKIERICEDGSCLDENGAAVEIVSVQLTFTGKKLESRNVNIQNKQLKELREQLINLMLISPETLLSVKYISETKIELQFLRNTADAAEIDGALKRLQTLITSSPTYVTNDGDKSLLQQLCVDSANCVSAPGVTKKTVILELDKGSIRKISTDMTEFSLKLKELVGMETLTIETVTFINARKLELVLAGTDANEIDKSIDQIYDLVKEGQVKFEINGREIRVDRICNENAACMDLRPDDVSIIDLVYGTGELRVKNVADANRFKIELAKLLNLRPMHKFIKTATVTEINKVRVELVDSVDHNVTQIAQMIADLATSGSLNVQIGQENLEISSMSCSSGRCENIVMPVLETTAAPATGVTGVNGEAGWMDTVTVYHQNNFETSAS